MIGIIAAAGGDVDRRLMVGRRFVVLLFTTVRVRDALKLDCCSQGLEEAGAREDDAPSTVSSNKN